jgi:hypothetical protein
MRENCKDISGRKEHSGVMAISAAPLEMRVRKPSVSTLKARGELRQFIPEAEDIGVFLPPFYKMSHGEHGQASNPLEET